MCCTIDRLVGLFRELKLYGRAGPFSVARSRDRLEAIDKLVQHPTMKFVATKTADQLDLQALDRASD